MRNRVTILPLLLLLFWSTVSADETSTEFALPDGAQSVITKHCVDCHGGDTATRLDSADAWRAHIDPIIALVSTGEMPLGGPSLSEDNIVAIRAWKHGGFL